jgi:hypothetical protein
VRRATLDLTAASWVAAASYLAGAGLALAVAGCGPHDAKHYRTRGQAGAHFQNCRPKCAARTAADWHECRR